MQTLRDSCGWSSWDSVQSFGHSRLNKTKWQNAGLLVKALNNKGSHDLGRRPANKMPLAQRRKDRLDRSHRG